MLTIQRYVSDLMSSNMYVVSENGHAIVIDPFRDTSASERLSVDRILLTHEHYDHISGVDIWKKATQAPVLCSKICAENIQIPRKNLSNHFKEFCELQTWINVDEIPEENPNYSCSADEVFENEMMFDWQGHYWYLFEMPGHSMGGIGILLDNRYFFSGDSLIENYDTEFRLPGGSRKKWKEISEPRLMRMPNDIQVYPGHFSEFVFHRLQHAACYS